MINQYHCIGCCTFFLSRKAKSFGSGCFDRDPVCIDLQLLTAFVMLVPLLALKISYGLEFGTITLVLIFLIQQAAVFIWSYLEALQINLNVALVKENEYGTDVG